MGRDARLAIPAVRPDGLQLNEARERQRRYWIIQRIAWIGYGLVMLVAVLGLTGSGGVFQKQTVNFTEATVEIPRISRWQGADSATITFTNAGDNHEVIVTRPFFDRFTIDRIQPEPAHTALLPDAQIMTFPAVGSPPHTVGFAIRAAHFGWTQFDMTIDGETRSVALLVLP